ncbi:transcription elongation factor Elf1 like-domain-containing protein [Fennellomyces sp. T-0311]|nr:transcription elongation factor Elf1 like-domain-containing protein [Fennellomyces sp. T-0311]
MGKRKVKRQAAKKLKAKLDTQFNCLFCNHEQSIEVRIDRSNKVGHLSCKICDVNWQCSITYLDEAVDVYSAWVDACEDVNKSRREQKARERGRQRELARESGDLPEEPRQRAPAPAQSGRSSFANDGLDPFDEDDEDDEDY